MLVALALAAVVPLAVGAVVAHRIRVRADQQASAEADIDRARRLGFDAVLQERQEDQRRLVTALQPNLDSARSSAEANRQRRESVSATVMGGRSPVWVIAGALLFLTVWVLAFRNLVELDRRLFAALGYDGRAVEAMARLVALSVSVIGLILADLVGITSLMPGVHRLPRHWRMALAASVAILFAIVLSQLPQLVEHRSAGIEQRLVELEANREALISQPDPDPAALAKLDGQISLELDKLRNAQFADKRTIVAVALVEAASSWSIGVGLGLLVAGALSLLEGAARRRIRRIEGENAALTQDLIADLMRLGNELGESPEQTRRRVLEAFEQEGGRQDDPPPPDGSGPGAEPPEGGPGPVPAGGRDPQPSGGPGTSLQEEGWSDA